METEIQIKSNDIHLIYFKKRSIWLFKKFVFLLFFTTLCLSTKLKAGELSIGTAVADITPATPVAVQGQFYLRIADTIETPLTANVIALESREGSHSLDAAIMVSCDLVIIPGKLIEMIRNEVHKQIPELDVSKIFLNATHTHTSPVLQNELQFYFRYQIPKEGVLQVEEYREFFVQRVSDAIVKAWENRQPGGSVTWGLGHASIANNRRVVYSKKALNPGPFANGKASMYGKTNLPDFMNLEGMADDDVNALFFWNETGKLIAMTISVGCPAQEVEGRLAINADYWYPVRETLKQKYGLNLCVLGWISAAGDQSPHILYRKSAEERMRKLRALTRVEEIARRIVLAVEDVYETVKEDRHFDVQLTHKVDILNLPMRLVTKEESEFAKTERDKYAAQMAADSSKATRVLAKMTWNAAVVRRFEMQKEVSHPKLKTEVHVLRIGDIVVCTNQFELFVDYGVRIQARSNALQTIIVQLAGPGTYLPVEKAVEGGGYSAIPQSNLVGPEGGQILVDRTVELINGMWSESK